MVTTNFYIADAETYSSGEEVEYFADNYFHEEKFYEDICDGDDVAEKELSFEL